MLGLNPEVSQVEASCQKALCCCNGLEYLPLGWGSDAGPSRHGAECCEPRAVLGQEKECCFQVENAALSKLKDKDNWEWGTFFLTSLQQRGFLTGFCFQASLLGLYQLV